MPLEAANGSHFGPNNCGDNDMGHMTLKRKISASEEVLLDLTFGSDIVSCANRPVFKECLGPYYWWWYIAIHYRVSESHFGVLATNLLFECWLLTMLILI